MSADALRETALPYRVSKAGSPYSPLIDTLYREEVLAARGMRPEEKFLAGESLFRYACAITVDGIRAQHPEWDDADCLRELRRRLELRERMDQQQHGEPQ